jgi:hypothetical protein
MALLGILDYCHAAHATVAGWASQGGTSALNQALGALTTLQSVDPLLLALAGGTR